jgi:hypothetical protein
MNPTDPIAQAEAAKASVTSGMTGIVMIVMLLAMYMIPTIIALLRKHRQAGAIAGLNILLGWTVLGWIGAFVWSLINSQPPQTVIIHNNTGPGSTGA